MVTYFRDFFRSKKEAQDFLFSFCGKIMFCMDKGVSILYQMYHKDPKEFPFVVQRKKDFTQVSMFDFEDR